MFEVNTYFFTLGRPEAGDGMGKVPPAPSEFAYGKTKITKGMQVRL